MKAVLQRVLRATVSVDGAVVGACGEGFLILLGVAEGDTGTDAELLAQKIVRLRVFCDENGKMNRSVREMGGEVLVVSQFTLLADYRHGNRPDFLRAAKPADAKRLYEYFTDLLRRDIPRVETGMFGADMKVELLNDGPVTIVMDSNDLKKSKDSLT